ncbi:MAG: hypothetical protein QXD09_07700 [Candidatus Caldarchaeum sp.]
MNLVDFARKIFFNLRRILRLTPTHAMMRSIQKHSVNLKSLHALELFGGRGDQTTRDYAPYVGQLEIWEIDPNCETALRKAFPNATIRITDSFEEIKKTPKKFDLVIADAWPRVFGNYCEHFELFPNIFRILSPTSILIFNVVPEIQKLTTEHARRRCAFYQVEDPTKIPLEVMIEKYKSLAAENGFQIRWWFYKDRYFLYPLRRKWLKKRLGFLVLGLQAVSELRN